MKTCQLFSLISLVVAVALPLTAQVYDATPGVPVRVWGSATGAADNSNSQAQIQVTGDGFLAATGGGTTQLVLPGSTSSTTSTTFSTPPGTAQMEPGKLYNISVNGAYAGGTVSNVALNMAPPLGYEIEIDDFRRQRSAVGSASHLFTVRLVGQKERGGMVAGDCTELEVARVYWQVGLGGLRNGGNAGAITITDPGWASDWSVLYTPSCLQYETPADEIVVLRTDAGVIRQIIANQAIVDVHVVSATAFELNFYHPGLHPSHPNYVAGGVPGQVLTGTDMTPRTFSGQPYISYRIEKDSAAMSLKITATTRNVASTNNWSAAASRTASTLLTRTGTWPAVVWTRKNWNTVGAVQVAEQVITSGGTVADRTDTLVARLEGTTTNAVYLDRAYKQYSWGEELKSSTAGSSNPMADTFDFYDNPVEVGRHGFMKSAIAPGGNWEAYDYWDATSAVGTKRIGTVRYVYRPFINAPATVGFLSTAGRVTTLDYSDDAFGWSTRPASVETRVNNVVTSRSTTSYAEPTGLTVSGQQVVVATRVDESGTASLTTTTKYFRENSTDFFLRNQPYSVTRPDNVKTSFAYQRGDFDEATKGFSANSTGLGSRIATITGTEGTGYPSYAGFDIDDLNLIAGKSTLETVIRDARSLVRRVETYGWVSDDWRLLTWTNYDYDTFGQLTAMSSSNGATRSCEYDGNKKTAEVDESGVRVEFDYDAAGRLWKAKKRTANGAGFATITTYTYDAAGRVNDETVSSGDSAVTETITQAHRYDDAGRLTSETPAGLGATTHSYDIASRSHTIKAPDTTTQVTTFNLDGEVAKLEGNGVVPRYYTYDVDVETGQIWLLLRQGTNASPRYAKQWTDWLGRVIKVETPGFSQSAQAASVTLHYYDNSTVGLGRRWKTTRTGYSATFYEFDELGQLKRTGLDVSGSDALELASTDRITEQNRSIEKIGADYWLTTETKIFATNNSDSATTASITRARITGFSGTLRSELQQIDAEQNTSSAKITIDPTTKTLVTERTAPGAASSETATTINGLALSRTTLDGLTYSIDYDGLERPWKAKDPRQANKIVQTYVTGSTLIESVTDAAGKVVVTSSYDGNGRVKWTRNAAGKYTRFAYNVRGQILRQWGDATSPVEYGYDNTYGDRTSMTTYRTVPTPDGSTWPGDLGDASTTTWSTDPDSGLVWKKTDASNKSVIFDYNVRGQTTQRQWARMLATASTTRVTTTYSYKEATGELWKITYNDQDEPLRTPGVEYSYTRLGQVSTIDQKAAEGGIGLTTLTYDSTRPWRLTSEGLPSEFGSRVLTRLYETATSVDAGNFGVYTKSTVRGRASGFELGVAGVAGVPDNPARDLHQAWTFSNQPRVVGMSASANGGTASDFIYSYKSNSGLLDGFARGNFSVTRDYEADRDLITRIESSYANGTATPTSVARFDYTYDDAGRRETMKQSGSAFAMFATATYDSTFYRYSYNARSELESARFYGGSDPTATTNELPGRRFEYRYDGMGNRLSSGATGAANGTVDSSGIGDENYEINGLNQYTRKENNRVNLAGSVAANAQVAIDGTMSTARADRAWANSIEPANGVGPAIGQANIFAAVGGSVTVRRESRLWLVAGRQQSFQYDADGNLSSDGLWSYTYDAENRLVRMNSTLPADFGLTFGYKRQRLDFRYDAQGRRVEKRVSELDSNGLPTNPVARRFIYDGWNLVAETDGSGAAMIRSYVWGLDLVGAPRAAGGVGALLQVTTYSGGIPAASYYPSFDANGNVTALTRASDGMLGAIYHYDPYGQEIHSEVIDPPLVGQPFRFSTKFMDEESGLVYFGLRYYSPSLGRFVNRDPKEEGGGLNLYAFCTNNCANKWDYLGMDDGFTVIDQQLSMSSDGRVYYDYGRAVYANRAPRGSGFSMSGQIQWVVDNSMDRMADSLAAAAAAAAVASDQAKLAAVQDRVSRGETVTVRDSNGTAMTFHPGDKVQTQGLGVSGGSITAANIGETYIVNSATLSATRATIGEIRALGNSIAVFENGQSNALEKAIKLGAEQTGAGQFVLHHNPTHGGFLDTMESAAGKLFGGTSQGAELANLLAATSDMQVSLTAHSQGGLTTNIAIASYTENFGAGGLPNLSVHYNGAAVTEADSRQLVATAGATFSGPFSMNPHDPIPVLAGGNIQSLPQLVDAVFRLPQAILGEKYGSTHTHYKSGPWGP